MSGGSHDGAEPRAVLVKPAVGSGSALRLTEDKPGNSALGECPYQAHGHRRPGADK